MTSPRDSGRSAVYELQFEHVTPDGGSVQATHERVTRVAVPEDEVLGVLKQFAAIAAMQMLDVEPQITIRAPHVLLQLRPYRGKLLICDPGASERVWRELTLDEVSNNLRSGSSAAAPAGRTAAEPELDTASPTRRRRPWPLAVLLVGLALNGYVAVSLFVSHSDADFVPIGDGHPPPDVTKKISGSYAASPPANVERIEFRPPNLVVFHGSGSAQSQTDSYLYGSYRNQPRLLTGSHGFIDLIEGRTLEFAGRRYERATDKH